MRRCILLVTGDGEVCTPWGERMPRSEEIPINDGYGYWVRKRHGVLSVKLVLNGEKLYRVDLTSTRVIVLYPTMPIEIYANKLEILTVADHIERVLGRLYDAENRRAVRAKLVVLPGSVSDSDVRRFDGASQLTDGEWQFDGPTARILPGTGTHYVRMYQRRGRLDKLLIVVEKGCSLDGLTQTLQQIS